MLAAKLKDFGTSGSQHFCIHARVVHVPGKQFQHSKSKPEHRFPKANNLQDLISNANPKRCEWACELCQEFSPLNADDPELQYQRRPQLHRIAREDDVPTPDSIRL